MTGKYIFIFLIVYIIPRRLHSSQVMKLFFKSHINSLIFFLLIACESTFNIGIAQVHNFYAHPWIQEINLPEHFNDIPNNSFHFDGNKNLFLGKTNGLTIINGNSSYHLSMDGPVYISGNESDTIYYASENDLGYLLKDKSGKFAFHSQGERLSRANRDFIPRQLICNDNGAFINTNRGVYHNTKGQIKYHSFPENEGSLHQVNGRLILRVNAEEVHVWRGEGFHKLTEPEREQDSFLTFAKRIEGNEDFTLLEYLSDKEAVVYSEKPGLLILNQEGSIIGLAGSQAGLPLYDVKQILRSPEDELWLLCAFTLHKTDLPSKLGILNLDPGLFGRILTSEHIGKRVFLGTNRGVFSIEPGGKSEGRWNITQVPDLQVQPFHLLSGAGSSIFAAGSRSLVSIAEGQMDEISRGSYTGIQAITRGLVIASGEQGLCSYRRTLEGWTKTMIDSLQTNAFSLVSFDKSVFLICKNKVKRLSTKRDACKSLSFQREEVLLKLLVIDGQMYLLTDQRAYRYEKSEETFLPVEEDHKAKILTESDLIISDKNGGLWVVSQKGKHKAEVIHQGRFGTKEAVSQSYPVLQNIGEIIDLNIRDSVLCLTGVDKIILLKLGSLKPSKPLPGPGILPGPLPQSSSSAAFQISGLKYQSTPEPEFRFRLDREQEMWSEWTTSSRLIFKRLKPGSHTLRVQSRDLYGRISDPSEIQFHIKAPFYRTWYAFVFYGFVLLIGLFIIRKLRLLSYRLAESRVSQRMQTKLDSLTLEKAKSDKIVADILPNHTANQIRREGKAKWDKYEKATVLFSDIQGFTKIAEEMNPEALIDELDQFFFHFDSVVEKYNIEKIKTIGDAYMAAGGIPEKNSTNPVEVVLAALEMQTYMQKLKSTKAEIWDLRIGVHTGPVIAGVVGHKKVSYDIWGDTVNTASRMESSGSPGKVNISGITYGMVKDYFICEYRGKLPVKYKGNIDMYFVTGLRPELAVDLKGIPNKRFFIKLQILRLGDLEDRVFGTILLSLPDHLHFHHIEYARKVYSQSFLLCRAEEVEQEDRLLLRTAALMLYTGLSQAYSNYENRSSVIARDILPEYKYSESQIDKICNLIMSTKLPLQPINQLEKILIDAKMEFIGRPDYIDRIKLLHKEMVETGTNLNGQQFKKQQLELLYTFDFFTIAARRLREVSGETQRTALEQERWI